jgi:hypothetical protein
VNIAVRIAPLEWELATRSTYVLTENDVEDGKNKLGMDVRHIALNVPLCSFCDGQLVGNACYPCQTIHTDIEPNIKPLGNGRWEAGL